jgi:hypothetical protein
MKINLPKGAKEQKIWMKNLGITDIRVAKLAVCREQAVELAQKRLKNRDYEGALNAVAVAGRMQATIETTQDLFKGLEL